MKKYPTLLFIFAFIVIKVCSQTPADSTKKSYLLALPFGGYSDETKWAGGVGASYYFWGKDALNQVSNITASAVYTQNKQATFGLYNTIYFNNKYFLYARFIAEKYPNRFWGVGNTNPDDALETYTPIRYHLNFEPQYFINNHNRLGVAIEFRNEEITKFEETGVLQHKQIKGTDPFSVIGLGGIYFYDTRDNNLYPKKGVYFKNALSYFGGSYSFLNVKSDFRYFKHLGKGHILANQSLIHFIIGEAPFQMLPTFGGAEQLRGYKRGQFRESTFILNQTEYRFPLYKRLSGILFVSAGNVFSETNKLNGLKISGGVGLRLRVNETGLNLRADMAKQPKGALSPYLSSGEAF